MYIFQNGKVYSMVDNKLVGVDLYLDHATIIPDCTDKLGNKFQHCTKAELVAKLNITEETPYIFPRKKVVTEDESVRKTEGTAARSTKRGRPAGTVSGNGKGHNNRTKTQ